MATYENFISYRRSETSLVVKNIYDALLKRGYSTFCDVYSLGSGEFSNELLTTIDNVLNFIIVLTPTSLFRCELADDWLKKELMRALSKKKNIIPIFVDGFEMPQKLDSSIASLKDYNGLKFDVVYFDFFIDRLINMFLYKDESAIIFADAEVRDFIIEDNILIKYVGHAKNVKIPDCVEVIQESAFKDHTEVEKIIFPPNLKEIQTSAFERCLNLSSIVLPKSLVKIDSRAFNRCFNANYLALSPDLSIIGSEAFSFCSKLKNVRLGPLVKVIDPSAFNNCSLLTEFNVEDENDFFTSIEGILYNKDKSVLVRCPEGYSRNIVDVNDTTVEIGPWAFSKCSKLNDIQLPRGLKNIGIYAFKDCYNISKLSLGDMISSFELTALDGWSSEQKVIYSNRFSPALSYNIHKKLQTNLASTEEVNQSTHILVKTTFESRIEAENMTRMLLDKKYIISGQISNLHSIYMWDDKKNSEDEFELSCITNLGQYKNIERFIKEHHSYELCQIFAIPILYTSKEFSNWINSYLKNEG